MTAPLENLTGAPVAQTVCATGEFALRVNPAAHKRATAPLPVAQAQQAGFSPAGQIRAAGAFAAPQQSIIGGQS